jgi:O-antigen biosynthesis protein
MNLSVIIVSFNACEVLKQCLLRAEKAAENIDCEIFVVDNNSSDGSGDMVRRDFPDIRLILNDTNSGFAAANNKAIRQATGQFILLLNPDAFVEKDTFSKCLDFMNAHTDAGAMGVKMVNGKGIYLPESKRGFPTPGRAFFKIFGFSSLFPRSRYFNRYYLSHTDINEISLTEVISGAFMFIKKEAIIRAGLPDEAFFMYGEDIDLSYRIMQAGYRNYYCPEIQIIHLKGKCTNRDNYNDIHNFYGSMRIYVRKRHKEKFNCLLYLIIPAIYLVQALSLFRRSVKIIFQI